MRGSPSRVITAVAKCSAETANSIKRLPPCKSWPTAGRSSPRPRAKASMVPGTLYGHPGIVPTAAISILNGVTIAECVHYPPQDLLGGRERGRVVCNKGTGMGRDRRGRAGAMVDTGKGDGGRMRRMQRLGGNWRRKSKNLKVPSRVPKQGRWLTGEGVTLGTRTWNSWTTTKATTQRSRQMSKTSRDSSDLTMPRWPRWALKMPQSRPSRPDSRQPVPGKEPRSRSFNKSKWLRRGRQSLSARWRQQSTRWMSWRKSGTRLRRRSSSRRTNWDPIKKSTTNVNSNWESCLRRQSWNKEAHRSLPQPLPKRPAKEDHPRCS